MQRALPGSDILCRPHSTQLVAEDSEENLPAPHGEHKAVPLVALNEPAAHCSQGPSSGPVEPSGQGTGMWTEVCNLSVFALFSLSNLTAVFFVFSSAPGQPSAGAGMISPSCASWAGKAFLLIVIST